jgi:hypothetical protein
MVAVTDDTAWIDETVYLPFTFARCAVRDGPVATDPVRKEGR